MEIRIDTFADLIEFLKTNDLTSKETNDIINRALKCFFIDDRPKDEMIEALITYWTKWKHVKERPIFIDFDPIA
jgi:hypothetical protein